MQGNLTVTIFNFYKSSKNYLYRGKPIELYKHFKQNVENDVILTSAIHIVTNGHGRSLCHNK